jgi:hypothetical protein
VDPGVEDLEGVGDGDHDVGVDSARWRLFGGRGLTTSHPQGATSDPRSKGGAAAARHRHGLLVVDEDELQMDLLVSLLFVLIFLQELCGLILLTPFFRKKGEERRNVGI